MSITARPLSAIGWLDYREDDAQRVRELLRAFDEKGTLDSIGIGAVRDTLADIMFPGLSTLHTRVRYFFLLPWLYEGLERDARGRPGLRNRLPAAAREREVFLMDALVAGGATDGGVIGIRRRERVRVLPRDVYWGGLRRLGFLVFQGPSRAYLDSVARDGSGHSPPRGYSDDGEIVAGSIGRYWRPGIPEAPDGFLEATTFDLSRSESAYFVERVNEAAPGTLLAELLRLRPVVDGTEAPWQVPGLDALPGNVREALEHAELFSHVIYGAQVLYNDLLAHALRGDGHLFTGDRGADLPDRVSEGKSAWLAVMAANASRFDSWDRAAFWNLVASGNPRLPALSRIFVETWITHALADPRAAYNSRAMADLIRGRERGLKGTLARLTSQRAREAGEPPFGMEPLNYRWRAVTRQLVDDISIGLVNGDGHA